MCFFFLVFNNESTHNSRHNRFSAIISFWRGKIECNEGIGCCLFVEETILENKEERLLRKHAENAIELGISEKRTHRRISLFSCEPQLEQTEARQLCTLNSAKKRVIGGETIGQKHLPVFQPRNSSVGTSTLGYLAFHGATTLFLLSPLLCLTSLQALHSIVARRSLRRIFALGSFE